VEEQPVFPIVGKMFLLRCYLLWSNKHKHSHSCSDAGGGVMLQLHLLGSYVTHQTSTYSNNR